MENWDLIPFKSVGPIFFTDTREDIINKFGEPKRILSENKYTGESFDFYWGDICFSKKTKEVYVVTPSDQNKCKILYEGLNLNVLD